MTPWIRCTGINCRHAYGTCTASPLYQRQAAAPAMTEAVRDMTKHPTEMVEMKRKIALAFSEEGDAADWDDAERMAVVALTAINLPALVEGKDAEMQHWFSLANQRALKLAALQSQLTQAREAIENARDVLRMTPELNMRNYNEDDVAAQNAGLIEVYTILDAAALQPTKEEEA